MVKLKRIVLLSTVLLLISTSIIFGGVWAQSRAAAEDKLLIYDAANLLSPDEYWELTRMAYEYGAEWETDFMILTYNEPGYDVMEVMQDFYDEFAPGFDKPHGNTAILTVDMSSREIYVGGFYKAKTYISNARADEIVQKITPDLSEGHYKLAFQKYIEEAHRYMGLDPRINPDLFLFNIWVQLGFALVAAWIIVKLMLRRSGSRLTVNSSTYEDPNMAGVLDYSDQYTHTSTSSRKIESSSSGSGSSGGGTTSGGHSHSGSRGSF